MGDELVELILYGFIYLYLTIRAGIYLDPVDGKYRIRKLRGLLFFGSRKRGFTLYNIVFQIVNYTLTVVWVIISIFVKERELTVLLARISYLMLVYTVAIINLAVGAWHVYKNDRKKKH